MNAGDSFETSLISKSEAVIRHLKIAAKEHLKLPITAAGAHGPEDMEASKFVQERINLACETLIIIANSDANAARLPGLRNSLDKMAEGNGDINHSRGESPPVNVWFGEAMNAVGRKFVKAGLTPFIRTCSNLSIRPFEQCRDFEAALARSET